MKIVAKAIVSPEASAYTEENLNKTATGKKVLSLIVDGVKKKVLEADTVSDFLKHCAEEAESGTCYGEASAVMTTFKQGVSEQAAVEAASKIDVIAFQILNIIQSFAENNKKARCAHKSLDYSRKEVVFEEKVITATRKLIEQTSKLKFHSLQEFKRNIHEKAIQWLQDQTNSIKAERVFRMILGEKGDAECHAVALFLHPKRKISLYDAQHGFKQFKDQKDFISHMEKELKKLNLDSLEIDIFKAKK